MKVPKYLFVLNILSILGFILTLTIISNSMPVIDTSTNSFISSIQTSSLINLSEAIGYIFDTKFLIIIAFLLSVYVFYKGFKKESSFLASSIVIGAALVYLLKVLVQRARPLNALVTENDFSFPSGHTTMSIIFIGILIFLPYKRLKSQTSKAITLISASIIVLIIMTSRLYISVHWLTDILGGIFLGFFVLTSFIILDKIFFKK